MTSWSQLYGNWVYINLLDSCMSKRQLRVRFLLLDSNHNTLARCVRHNFMIKFCQLQVGGLARVFLWQIVGFCILKHTAKVPFVQLYDNCIYVLISKQGSHRLRNCCPFTRQVFFPLHKVDNRLIGSVLLYLQCLLSPLTEVCLLIESYLCNGDGLTVPIFI